MLAYHDGGTPADLFEWPRGAAELERNPMDLDDAISRGQQPGPVSPVPKLAHSTHLGGTADLVMNPPFSHAR